MDTEHKDEEAIFKAAYKLKSSTKRMAYLKRACGNDTDLLARVNALLKAHEEAGSFLEVPDVGHNATLDDVSSIEGPGTKIGRYELLELIGEGGMGLVYLARQKKPVKRQVALKIIKPGMDSRQVIARFEAERQTLAVLDHPNIAHVLDAGTTKEGRPYFIMEYVKGMSITKYCDENKLNIEQRLRLFEQVCEGVHHAHQKGIIHRDIKPSNILVSVHGDRAVPKIIDFGIAKAVAQPLTEKTLVTFQGQLLGTPEYMSPEQVDMATQDIDIRSDIYSLGVVLYELLAGVVPFGRELLAGLGFAEIQRTIREKEPASPSTRLTSLGEKAKTIAESRGTQVVALARRLHRELEWIPLKAMRKERCRRYKSASEMTDDIRNYLNGNPLIAGPETAIYRVNKFVHKHAGSVATAAIIALAIILGLVISTAMYFKAEKARVRAEKAETTARQQREVAEQAREQEAIARVQAEESDKIAQDQRKLAEERAEEYRRSLYFNRIALAEAAYRNSNMQRVRELLDLCPADLRAWEWHYLKHISEDTSMTLEGHGDLVFSVAFSPDGKRIVSRGRDMTLKIWDAATGAELMTLSGHSDEELAHAITSEKQLRLARLSGSNAVFSPDGKRILSTNDNTVKVCDAQTGTEIMTLDGHERGVGPVLFSPDGKIIASGSMDNTIKIWDAAIGAELKTLRGHDDYVISAAFNFDGSRIVSGSADETIKVWDASTGAVVITLRGLGGPVLSVAFSPDGKRIASSSMGNMHRIIKVWDVPTGMQVMTLRGHARMVIDVAFSPDGKRIVSGSSDGTVKVWDAATGDVLKTFSEHSDWVEAVALSPDGGRIVSGSKDGTIRIWDTVIDRERVALNPKDAGGRAIFSPDGTRIYLVGHGINVLDMATGTELMAFPGGWRDFASVALSPDGKRIVSGSWGGTIRVWEAATAVELMSFSDKKSAIYSVLFSPDGKRIVTCNEEGTVKIWEAATGVELVSFDHNSMVFRLAISPDGERIVTGCEDKTVRIWESATGAELMTLRGHADIVTAVTFSPDGKYIISGDNKGTIKRWDATSGKELISVQGHALRLNSVAFSPGGKRIISSGRDGTLKLWDAATGAEVMILPGHDFASATFSPDGKTIAFGTTLLETETPPNGYGPRRTGAAAHKLVDELYEKHGLFQQVINELKNNKVSVGPAQRTALQIANARLREDAEKLNQESMEVVSSPGREIDTYKEALEKAERANSLNPDAPSMLTTLGMAQYRVGAYEEALETLSKSMEIIRNFTISGGRYWQPDPANPAFRAMALHQLGRNDEAKTVLVRLRILCSNQRFSKDKQAQEFLAEAMSLIVKEGESLEGVEPFEESVKPVIPPAQLVAFYERRLRNSPNLSRARNGLAWLLATCPDDDIRDGAKAVEHATKACELTNWENAGYVDTLAAAYAESGDFDSAVKHQKKAIDLLSEEEDGPRTDMEKRLELYQSGKPYRGRP